MDILEDEDIIKLNTFDFCHSKVRKGKRAMWCINWRLVYIKDSSDDSICIYWKQVSYIITDILINSNKINFVQNSKNEVESRDDACRKMMEDLKKQVAKCENCSEWIHPI